MRVVVVAGDVVPGMGVPVAAPGLRAWGMALGLRDHGHVVTVVVDPGMTSKVWPGPVPAPLPPSTLLLPPALVPRLVATQGVDAVVMNGSNHADALSDVGCPLVYDFFAPKMLEIGENTARADRAEALAKLEERKLRTLARVDGVVVNGVKKLGYVRGWLDRAGATSPPPVVVNPGLPALASVPFEDGRLHVMVGGYLQPWSRPGAWVDAVLPLLDDDVARLHLLVGRHWGQVRTNADLAPELRRLAGHPAVITHGLLRFGDFRRLLGRCHLALDVFARNPERELAMVTRSVVALAGGVPVVHVPFTEVSPWIERYDAGWLVDGDDAPAMSHLLREALDRGTAVQAAGAARVAREVLDPATAAAPLHQLLTELVSSP